MPLQTWRIYSVWERPQSAASRSSFSFSSSVSRIRIRTVSFFIIIISFGYNTCSLRGYRAARPERVHRPGGCGRVVTSSISFVSVQARKLFIPLRLLSPQNLRLCGDPFFRRGVLARSYPVRTVIQFFFLGGSFPFRANRKSRFTRAPCRKDRDTLSKQEVM